MVKNENVWLSWWPPVNSGSPGVMIIVINILYRLIIQYIHSIYPILYTRHEYKHTCKVIFTILGFQGSSRPSSISILNISLFVYIVEQNKPNIFGFYNKFSRSSKFIENRILLEANFWNFDMSYTLLGTPHWCTIEYPSWANFCSPTLDFHQFTITKAAEECVGFMWGPTQIWARSVQPFWRLLDPNGQTN